LLKIGIVGSRRRNTEIDRRLIHETFKQVSKMSESVHMGEWEECIIVSGGCQEGADAAAEELARLYGITIIIHHANWSLYGKRAGHIRNQKIAEDSDVLIACVAPDRTGGTESTIEKYTKLNKKELIII